VEGGEAVCPGEVTLTCTVTEGVSLGWISEPYIPWLNAVEEEGRKMKWKNTLPRRYHF